MAWADDLNIKTIVRDRVVKLSVQFAIIPEGLMIQEGIDWGTSRIRAGEGGYAVVYRAEYNGVEIGLKLLRGFGARYPEVLKEFCREILLWKDLRHPRVLPFLGVHLDCDGDYFMVTPWMSKTSISRYLRSRSSAHVNLPRVILETAEAVAYVHSKDVIHGDLRGENVLVDDEGHILLADFGLCGFADANTSKFDTEGRGNRLYMAPEIRINPENFQRTRETDVYSFAFLCIEVYLEGYPPDTTDFRWNDSVWRPPRPPKMGVGIWDLVNMCWETEPQRRPAMQTVVDMLTYMPDSHVEAVPSEVPDEV